MHRKHEPATAGGTIILLLVLLNAIGIKHGMVTHSAWYYMLFVTIPLLLVCIFKMYRQ